MGNVIVFEKAFKECGIGSKFSKFQIVQRGDWFELVDVVTLVDFRYCYKVLDRVDVRALTPIDGTAASVLHQQDPQWTTCFMTAQKVMAKIISKGNSKSPNRYYYDQINESVYLINRMFVIEITPTLRVAPHICSTAIFSFLDKCGYRKPSVDDCVKVHTKFDRVVIDFNNLQYDTLQCEESFNSAYGEAV